MAPSPCLDKQTAGCNSLHNWLLNLAMDLAALCDTYVEVKMAPTDAIWLFSVLTQPLPTTLWLPTLTLPPCRSASDIGYASKEVSKMVGKSPIYPRNSWWIDYRQLQNCFKLYASVCFPSQVIIFQIIKIGISKCLQLIVCGRWHSQIRSQIINDHLPPTSVLAAHMDGKQVIYS